MEKVERKIRRMGRLECVGNQIGRRYRCYLLNGTDALVKIEPRAVRPISIMRTTGTEQYKILYPSPENFDEELRQAIKEGFVGLGT